MNFGEFQIKDNLAMLFLLTAYFSLVSGCKDIHFFYIVAFSEIIF